MAIYTDPKKRHDFVLLFDVKDGNPNGDPDAGNLPRVDPETMQGIVTDVAIKRKVRNYIDLIKGDQAPYMIYVQNKGIALNTLHERAYKALNLEHKGTKQPRVDIDKTRTWMCQNFFDIRMFGAVMTTGVNCGQVRGPIQLSFARSVDRVIPMDISITRVAITKPEDAQVVYGEEGRGSGKQTEMGRKALIPYGLYRLNGFINPKLGEQTGLTEEDLELFWKALINMWDQDRSAARGVMASRALVIFTHSDAFGNAPAHILLERVNAERKNGAEAPRSFSDYEIQIPEQSELPEGITMTRLL
jgi:CRISPR-associated protein Csd2